MTTYSIPYDLDPGTYAQPPGLSLLHYSSQPTSVKNRISLQQHLFSFVLSGQKETIYSDTRLSTDNRHFLLLSAGNCLMSEKIAPDNGRYESLLLFFDHQVLSSFLARHPQPVQNKGLIAEPAVRFKRDVFLDHVVEGLGLIASQALPQSLLQPKFDELMLYLFNCAPQRMQAFTARPPEPAADAAFRQIVERHIESSMTIEELAFLCNTSLSTFKRRFTRLYGLPPNRWLLGKRMETAAFLLQRQEKPSEVYHKVGYENLSSFIQSFKHTYGVTPREYQLEKMNS